MQSSFWNVLADLTSLTTKDSTTVFMFWLHKFTLCIEWYCTKLYIYIYGFGSCIPLEGTNQFNVVMEVVSSSSTGLVTQNCPLQSSKEEWCSISPYTFLTLEIYLRKIIFINIYKYLLCRKKNMVLFIAVWMYIAHRFWI